MYAKIQKRLSNMGTKEEIMRVGTCVSALIAFRYMSLTVKHLLFYDADLCRRYHSVPMKYGKSRELIGHNMKGKKM